MTTQRYPRPLPESVPEWQQFWDKAKAHELWIMRCNDCNQPYFYPRPICPNCFSRNTAWMQASGKGTLYTFAIVHRPPNRGWQDEVPYVPAIILLEEGVRLSTNLIEVEPDPAQIKVGMAVEVVFDEVTDEVTLPKFRPAR